MTKNDLGLAFHSSFGFWVVYCLIGLVIVNEANLAFEIELVK